MTVKWCEPFEDAAAFQVPGYSAAGGGGETISATSPRTGLGCFQNGGDSGRSHTWNLLSNPAMGAGWADFLIGFGVQVGNVTTNARRIFSFQEGATIHGYLNVNTSEQLELYANGVLRATSSALAISTWYHVSVVYVVHDTTGVAELWLNDVQQGSTFNGDTRNAGTAGLVDAIRHGDGANGLEGLRLDDLVLADRTGMTRIPDCKVEADYPSGNGTNSGLTGSDGNSTDNFALVDETGTPNLADYVGSPTPGTKDTYLTTDTDAPLGAVLAVQVRNHALKSDAGAISGRSIILSNGSTAVGADLTLSTTAVPLDTVFPLNPDGSVAWTLATVDAAEPGFEVRA